MTEFPSAPPPGPELGRGEPPAPGAAEPRFPVDLPGFHGTLEELVLAGQRGDVDLADIPVSSITRDFHARLRRDPQLDAREVADFLQLAARLVSLKAGRLLPEGRIEAELDQLEEAPADDGPGERLAEYRLFRAAAEALLADASEHGVRSFASLVSPDVVPSERLSIAPERLASAFRAVLARLPDRQSLEVETVTYSVEEKLAELRAVLEGRRSLPFQEVFAAARSRLEAVAVFLALLELVRLGEADVVQPAPFGEITVSRRG